MALRAYRTLLRQIRSTFQGDDLAIRKFQREARTNFQANRNVTDSSAIAQHVAMAEETAVFIKQSIIQAKRTGGGTYSVNSKQAQQLQDVAPDIVKPTKG